MCGVGLSPGFGDFLPPNVGVQSPARPSVFPSPSRPSVWFPPVPMSDTAPCCARRLPSSSLHDGDFLQDRKPPIFLASILLVSRADRMCRWKISGMKQILKHFLIHHTIHPIKYTFGCRQFQLKAINEKKILALVKAETPFLPIPVPEAKACGPSLGSFQAVETQEENDSI